MTTYITVKELTDQAKKAIIEIDIAKAKTMIDAASLIIIDVREKEEVAEGSISGAHFIPRGVLEFKIDTSEALKNKSETILLYCRSGNRSALAAETLQRFGYTNVISLMGGHEAWKVSFDS